MRARFEKPVTSRQSPVAWRPKAKLCHGKALCMMMLISTLALAGCLGGGTKSPTSVPATATPVGPAAYTEAAETISAVLTQNAQVVQPAMTETAAAAMMPPLTPTEEPLPATSTPLPTNTPLPSDTPLPTPTSLPTATFTPAIPPTATLPPEPVWLMSFSDDFTRGYWVKEKTDGMDLRYKAGGYSIYNNVIGDIVFSVRNPSMANVRIEVDGARQRGPLDGYYGVVCNFTNGGNYYLLAIGVDGWYGIGMKLSSRLSFFEEGYDQTATIHTGGGPNRIRADCYNGMLVLWVNDVRLLAVQDYTFSAGQVGMAVGTRNAPGVEVLFDNFDLYTSQTP
jgi:hypothetical protein